MMCVNDNNNGYTIKNRRCLLENGFPTNDKVRNYLSKICTPLDICTMRSKTFQPLSTQDRHTPYWTVPNMIIPWLWSTTINESRSIHIDIDFRSWDDHTLMNATHIVLLHLSCSCHFRNVRLWEATITFSS